MQFVFRRCLYVNSSSLILGRLRPLITSLRLGVQVLERDAQEHAILLIHVQFLRQFLEVLRHKRVVEGV